MNRFSAFGLMLFVSAFSSAQETAEEVAEKTLKSPLDNLDVFQMIAPLLLVILLIFALAWLVKKLNPRLPTVGQDIQILSTTPLSSQSKLCLVRAGGKDILIGVTSNNISHIQTFTEPVVSAQKNDHPTEFSQQFKQLLNKTSAGKTTP